QFNQNYPVVGQSFFNSFEACYILVGEDDLFYSGTSDQVIDQRIAHASSSEHQKIHFVTSPSDGPKMIHQGRCMWIAFYKSSVAFHTGLEGVCPYLSTEPKTAGRRFSGNVRAIVSP